MLCSFNQGRHALIICEGGMGRHVTHSSHNSTYVLFIFSFLFETFPNTLTISWNILILTFIDYVSRSIVGDGQSNLIM